MSKRHHHKPVTLEELLQEQAAVAYCMMKDGPVYAPDLERYEREMRGIARPRGCDVAGTAGSEDGQATLTADAGEGGVKAIA